jgi:hypothetical protein
MDILFKVRNYDMTRATWHGIHELTPYNARLALEQQYGEGSVGIVWDDKQHYGYRVYKNSAKKITHYPREMQRAERRVKRK